MEEQIRQALALLDPSNDDHWTSQGLPSMEVVNGLVDGEPVTRAQLNRYAPGFSRSTAGPTEAPDAPEPTREPSEVEILEAAIAERNEKIRELSAKRNSLNGEIRRLTKEADRDRRKLATLSPPRTHTEIYREYLERTKEHRRRVAERRQSVQPPTDGRSALDRAMALKSGYGLDRPSY